MSKMEGWIKYGHLRGTVVGTVAIKNVAIMEWTRGVCRGIFVAGITLLREPIVLT